MVRLSGPQALNVAARLFRPHAVGRPPLEPGRACRGSLHDPHDGRLLDEVIVTAYRTPHSYTGEDLVEISAHGNPIVLRNIVAACLAAEPSNAAQTAAIRLAQPGEFTCRAFLNGKLSLEQAEAVADLIGARSEQAAQAALTQLRGRLGEEIRSLQSQLTRLLAHLEASLDFPEEELEAWTREQQQNVGHEALAQLIALRDSYQRGRVLREGLTVVIIGRPNVGKSSLLNALLRRDRAIVTPHPGTTRDTLEETTEFAGVAVRLIDTAGLSSRPFGRCGADEVEQLGIARAQAAVAEADLVLLVLDTAHPLTGDDHQLLSEPGTTQRLLVFNKTDLPPAWDTVPHAEASDGIRVSALTGAGLAQLETALVERGMAAPTQTQELVVTRLRHKEALDRAATALTHALNTLTDGLPAEVTTIPLRECLQTLGEITGDDLVETALHAIFSEFCIGK